MKKISDQINTVSAKQQQLANRLTNLRNRQKKSECAKEARRLILAGKWMLKLNGGDIRKVGERLDEAGLLSARDRDLFGLLANKKGAP